ncbi:MAG: hypothetical protein ACK4RK_08175, partial [Gemmataceae bacterium]
PPSVPSQPYRQFIIIAGSYGSHESCLRTLRGLLGWGMVLTLVSWQAPWAQAQEKPKMKGPARAGERA